MTTTNFDSGSLNFIISSTSATYDGWTFGTSANAIDFANYSNTEWLALFNKSSGRSIFLLVTFPILTVDIISNLPVARIFSLIHSILAITQ